MFLKKSKKSYKGPQQTKSTTGCAGLKCTRFFRTNCNRLQSPPGASRVNKNRCAFSAQAELLQVLGLEHLAGDEFLGQVLEHSTM